MNEKCIKCGSTDIEALDGKNEYEIICSKCFSLIKKINKQDYVSKFECPECGGLSGTLEENDVKLGVRCNNCHKLFIMLEKHPNLTNRRNAKDIPRSELFSIKCPKCGSTAVTTGQRGYSLWTGFLGAGKTVNRCGSCGYKWKP